MGTYSRKNKIWKNIFMATTVIFLLLSLILGGIVFFNWDYISFKALMTQRYIHTGLLDELVTEHVGVDSNGDFIQYFDNLSIAAVTEMINETGKDYYTYQYNPSQYQSYQTRREETAAQSHIKELTPDTVYMLLTNFTDDSLVFFESSINAIEPYDNLVLDLRDNGGGDIDVILEIADYFMDKYTIMLQESRRHKTVDIRAKNGLVLSYDNLVIMQNERTASAAEQLITALTSNLEEVSTVGVSTYGKYVGQTRIPLLRNFYVRATTLEWTAPDGTRLPAGGITPDYFYTEQDIIDYVLEALL
jgi:C-terminal processing protease CtpA/Prc